MLGEICYHEQSFPQAVELFAQALEHGAGDASLVSAIELHLAYASNAAGDFAGAEPHARRALALAEQLGDGPRLAEAIAVSSMVGFLLGRGIDEAEVERALSLEDRQRQTTVELRPSLIAGLLTLYTGQLECACRLLGDLRQRILDRGEDSDLPYVSACLGWAESWRGNLDAAARFAEEALGIVARTGMASMRCAALALGSVPPAFAGDAGTARDRAGEAFALAAETGYGIGAVWAGWSLAVLALSGRDPAAAYAALAPWRRRGAAARCCMRPAATSAPPHWQRAMPAAAQSALSCGSNTREPCSWRGRSSAAAGGDDRPATSAGGPWNFLKRPARGAGPSVPAPNSTAQPRVGQVRDSPGQKSS